MFFDRSASGPNIAQGRSRPIKTHSYLMPRRGEVQNDNIARPSMDGAEVLDNFYPTASGARLRAGSVRHATAGSADEVVSTLAAYEFGATAKLFACCNGNVIDVTAPADPDVEEAADVTGQTSDYYSKIQFSTTGAHYLVMVNGADDMIQYDGTSWAAINAASTPAITGVATSALSAVWEHKSRIWLIEGGTLSAWYLPVDARAGAATEFPLNGIFKHGGSLLFGATWSLDSGDGLDDVNLFVTNQGEIAVYQGTDPSNASTWALVGVYKIGRPMGKNAFFQAGGDVAIITDDGIVPVSEAIKRDRAAVQEVALTFPIEDVWRRYIETYNGTDRAFEGLLWPQKAMLLVTIPTLDGEVPHIRIANSRTGAWARYTGWDARCMAILGDRVFFGTSNGTVVEAEKTGADRGQVYIGRYVPKFTDFRSHAEKAALHARVVVRTDRSFTPELFAISDYSEDYPTPGSGNMEDSVNVWGTAVWGEAVWSNGAATFQVESDWQTVAATGAFLAPGLHIAAGITAEPNIEVVALWIQYEQGRGP